MNEIVGLRRCSKTPPQTRLQALNAFNTLSRAILCSETNSFWNSSREPGTDRVVQVPMVCQLITALWKVEGEAKSPRG